MVAKVNNIDTSRFLLKAKDEADKTELERKTPDVTDLVKIQNPLNWNIKFPMLLGYQQKLH